MDSSTLSDIESENEEEEEGGSDGMDQVPDRFGFRE